MISQKEIDRKLSKDGVDGYSVYDCILWRGPHHNSYPVVDGWNKVIRILWQRAWGDVPGQLNHICNNSRCINLAHVYLGTQQENILDQYQNGRISPFSGLHMKRPHTTEENSRHSSFMKGNAYRAKLTHLQVKEIRRRYIPWKGGRGRPTNPNSSGALAIEFGVTLAQIKHIVKRRSWRELN